MLFYQLLQSITSEVMGEDEFFFFGGGTVFSGTLSAGDGLLTAQTFFFNKFFNNVFRPTKIHPPPSLR